MHNSGSKKYYWLLNLGGFALALTIILALTYYQLFVNGLQQKLTIKELLNVPKVLANLGPAAKPNQAAQLKTVSKLFAQDPALFAGATLDQISFSPQFDKFAFLEPENAVIYQIESQLAQKVALPDHATAQLVGWGQDNESIYVALKQEDWEIVQVKQQLLTSLVKGIQYHQSFLTKTSDVIYSRIIYPECTNVCTFKKFNLATNQVEQTIPVENIAHDPENIALLFFDETKSLIGYHNPSNDAGRPEEDMFYLIEYDKNSINTRLIQTVYSPLQTKLEFVAFFSQAQVLLFKTYQPSANTTRFFSYASNSPSLKVLLSFSGDLPCVGFDQLGVFRINNQYFDLAGLEVK